MQPKSFVSLDPEVALFTASPRMKGSPAVSPEASPQRETSVCLSAPKSHKGAGWNSGEGGGGTLRANKEAHGAPSGKQVKNPKLLQPPSPKSTSEEEIKKS